MDGQIFIKFKKQMNISLNIFWINSSYTLIYVQPQDKRQLEIGFNCSTLNLNWIVDSYNNDVMKINLTSDNPLEISTNI
jgi:hypothetical protein